MSKSTSKSLSDKYTQNLLDYSKQAATDEFKTNSRKLIRKTAETTADLIGKNTMLIKLEKSKEHHQKLVQGQLQMKQKILDLKEKYQKKDIYLQEKNDKLLIM